MQTLNVAPVEDLIWLYHESASELGLRAQTYDGTGGSAPWDTPHPTRQQQGAARRQRLILEALASLDTQHKSAIDIAYEQRRWDTEDSGGREAHAGLRQYGQAAGIVARVLADRREAEDEARGVLRSAMATKKRLLNSKSGTPAQIAEVAAFAAKAKAMLRDETDLTKRAATRAVALLREAHDAFRAARRAQKAGMRAELDAARLSKRAKREALLAEYLNEPEYKRRRAKASALLQAYGVKVSE